MTLIRSLHLAFLFTGGLSSASAQSVIFQDDFENGLGNWSVSSMWHLEASAGVCGATVAPFPSGDLAARFGQLSGSVCNFNGTPVGDITMVTPVSIPAGASHARLNFWSFEETECGPNNIWGFNCGWDHRYVLISTDGGQLWTEIAGGGPGDVWLSRTVDLTSYIGEDVLIRFRFDAIDDVWNEFLGWVVDDVVIEFDDPVPEDYCTAKVNSLGCTPVLSHAGVASLTSSDPFTVTATQILNGKASKLIWSRAPNAQPFQGGTLCVAVPAARTQVTSSGGNSGTIDCSGVYTWAFTPSYLASKSFFAGETMHVQFSGRDPGFAAPGNHSLSAALAVTFVP